MMRKLLLITITLAIMLVPVDTFAGIYGVLKGKVVDDDKKPVIGATIRVEGTARGGYSKAGGRYQIMSISAGKYTVKVTRVGKADFYAKNVSISADRTTNLNITLSDKDIKKDVVIITAKKLVDHGEQGSINTISSEEMSGPQESIQAIVGLTAGVTSSGGGFSIRGSRTSETQVRLDGLDIGNQFSGGTSGLFPMVSTLATQEVSVMTGAFSAEYGDAMGGIVNTILKTGSTKRYEGHMRYRTDLPSLNGYQESSLTLEKTPEKIIPIREGDGAQLQGPNSHKVEFGIGGPMHILNNSTFFLSSSYDYRETGGGYKLYDPDGNNLGQMPDNQTWLKNITGRIRLGVTDDIYLIIGGMFGTSSSESTSWGWLYTNDEGLMFDQQTFAPMMHDHDNNPNTPEVQRTNGIPERVAKATVYNNQISNALIRINHSFDNGFYELTFSNSVTNDQIAKRVGDENPGYFTGYELATPKDNYILEGTTLMPGQDTYVDNYQILTDNIVSSDGYFKMPSRLPNPLTGYIEGPTDASGSNNPFGTVYSFVTHGNGGLQIRNGNYYQLDGNFNYHVDGDNSKGEFDHMIKTGFELRYYNMAYHRINFPWEGTASFYDVYSDEWGGNLYADTDEEYELTSKPVNPMKASAYIQDQITYNGIIFSPGVRFDMFMPNSDYRTSDERFVSILADSGFSAASNKFAISPRINVTYPITDMSNISIAYGQYFKVAELTTMYDSYNLVTLRQGGVTMGDPNMEAQQTNSYQVAYVNALTSNFKLTVTAYYKDIYNQLGTIYIPANPKPYYQFAVSEYGNSKGIEIGLRKRPTKEDNIGANINYTLGQVEGTASSAWSNTRLPIDPYTNLIQYPLAPYRLSQDVRHRINFSLNLIWWDNQGPSIAGIQPLENTNISFTTTWRSGYPYTARNLSGEAISGPNTESGPSYTRTDMRFSKRFMLKDWFGDGAGHSAIEFFVDIYNLFSRAAVTGFYTTTGDPIDNGISFYRNPGNFSSGLLYEKADFSNVRSFNPEQYDNFGNRTYNPNGDFDGNGIINQEERFDSYILQLETSTQFQGNYQSPRTVYAGVMFRF